MSDVRQQQPEHHENHGSEHNQEHQHDHEHEYGHGHGNGDPFSNPSKMFILRYTFRNWIRRRSYYKELVKQLNLNGSESVLDFGSGVGSLAKKLAPKLNKNGRLVCLDVSPKLLDHTKNQLHKYSNVEYLLGDLPSQSLSEQSFDYIISTWVLHHLERSELEQTIIQFSKTLKSGGKIFIIEFPEGFEHTHNFHHMIKVSDILALFNEQNFSQKVLISKPAGVLYEFTR